MVEKKKNEELSLSLPSMAAAADQGQKFDIAAELAKARRRVGLSQSQLAEKSGVSRNTLMGYESGRNKPGAREIKVLCEVLQITPNRLIFGSEDPFKARSALAEVGIEDEDLEAAVFPVMLRMLARDERDAVLTLVHNLLEARHGEDYRIAIRAMEAAMAAIRDQATAVGAAIEGAISEDVVQKLSDKVEASIRNVTNSKGKPKRG